MKANNHPWCGRRPAILGRALSRAHDATGIAYAPAFALTFHNSGFDWTNEDAVSDLVQ